MNELPEWYLNLLAIHSFRAELDEGATHYFNIYCVKCGRMTHSSWHPDTSKWTLDDWQDGIERRRDAHVEECKS